MVIYTAKTNEKIAQITANLASPYASDLDKKCFIFCEDKNTLMLESAIAKRTGGSFNVYVNSFSRYISTRVTDIKALSKSASALVIYDIINKLRDELIRIRQNNSPKLSENIYKLIAQLKSAKVKPCDLLEVIENESGAFSTKLSDVYKIYTEYENYLSEKGLFDSNNFFGLIPEIVKNDTSLKGAKVIFSGFSSLTRQIIDIFKAVAKVCDCDFVLLKGDGVFYTNEIYDRVVSVFPSAKIKEHKGEYLPESLAIEKGLFNPEFNEKDGVYSDKVRIIESATQIHEIENVAKRIRYEVVKNGKRYKDFAIACNNPSEYSEIVLDVFKNYEIPVYIDVKNTMEKHPIVRLILSALEVARQNYLPSAVLNLCAERLVTTQEEYNAFERFINVNAIGRRAMKKPFSTDFEGVDVESVRLRVLSFVEPFKKQTTARQFVDVCRKIISEDYITLKSKILSQELKDYGFSEKASINEQVLNKIEHVFFEIENIIGDKPMNPVQFKMLFNVAVTTNEVSILPLYSDVVYMGDFKSVKQREAKILFAIGISGDIPKTKSDTALLTDRDLVKMEAYKCIIEPKIQIINKRERENVGVSLMSFSEKLYISYAITSARGENVILSDIIDYFKKIFLIGVSSNVLYKDSGLYDGANDIYSFMTKTQGMRSFALGANDFSERKISSVKTMTAFLSAISDDKKLCEKMLSVITDKQTLEIPREVITKLSASIIEKYFNCPYACFASYNLKLYESETGEARSLDFGNLLHLILEKYVEQINFVSDKQSSDDLCNKLYEDALKLEPYVGFLNKKQYEHIFKIVKKEAIKRCFEIFTEYENTKFKPIGQEVKFGDSKDADYGPIELDTPYGKRYISGKVDRIDKYGDYIRVIDYKTGSVSEKIKEEKLYTGTNIQLYLYPLAFLDDKTKLGGVYYYKVGDPYVKNVEESNDFVGRTLLDEDVVYATDLRLQTMSESKKYNIKISEKAGNRTIKDTKQLLTKDELNAFMTYAKKVCESGSSELSEGFIAPYPLKGACEYCKFGGMCGYDAELEDTQRDIGGITKNKIISAIEEDGDE